MKPETRTHSGSSVQACQNCKKNFTIEPEDFNFYEKIKVPSPTFCPECRMIRRMMWRNERDFSKVKCNAPKHDEFILSSFNSIGKYKIYDQKYWWSDEWDPMQYGQDYYFSNPFFLQFKELFESVPHDNVIVRNNVNSNYTNWSINNKNCYLSFGILSCENVMYSANRIFNSRDSMDLFFVDKLESSYEDINCQNSFCLFFSNNCNSCLNSYFLYDCKNCSNCIACVGLRNKQYYIFNKPYSKKEYGLELNKLNFGSYNFISKMKEDFKKFKILYPHKYANIISAENSTGDYLINVKNCKNCFDFMSDSENCKYIFRGGPHTKDGYDCFNNSSNNELSYEGVSISQSTSNVVCSVALWTGVNMSYSYYCHNCKNCFGCIGLRGKQFCILNKQYTKEQYEELIPKIIKQMNDLPYISPRKNPKTGEGQVYQYGEFFPPELSPFCYNETIAQEYFPLTKEEALRQGYRWKEREERNYTIDIKNEALPDDIKDITTTIVGKVIECNHKGTCNEQCTEAFKIIPEELSFYQR
ncbi:MAG: hypothetical protein WC822_05010, partial [Candidatus Paceibacterota bacterium]